MQRMAFGIGLLVLCSGCVVVGGYSSGRGWFIWPGGIVFLLLIIGLFLLLKRRYTTWQRRMEILMELESHFNESRCLISCARVDQRTIFTKRS
jgi:nitrate reductase gamma subunit